MDSPSTPKNKRSFPNELPRTQRTCVEKNQIIDYYNSIKEIYGAKAKTVKKFELKSTRALSRILEKEQKFNELIEENRLDSSRKRIRLSAHEILEESLFKFMTNVRSNNCEISGMQLKIKSLEIATQLNIKNFKGSDGFLSNFKKRNNIKFKSFSGEGGSVVEAEIDLWFLNLGKHIKTVRYSIYL
jgi:hypothetical protein